MLAQPTPAQAPLTLARHAAPNPIQILLYPHHASPCPDIPWLCWPCRLLGMSYLAAPCPALSHLAGARHAVPYLAVALPAGACHSEANQITPLRTFPHLGEPWHCTPNQWHGAPLSNTALSLPYLSQPFLAPPDLCIPQPAIADRTGAGRALARLGQPCPAEPEPAIPGPSMPRQFQILL